MALRSRLLGIAGLLSLAVAVAHVWIIVSGAPAYRYTGAGELMVRLAEEGSTIPALVTTGAILLFLLAGLYPLSAAGWLPRLPMLHAGLVCIATVYTARGLALPVQLTGAAPARELVFSAVSLAIGLVYIAATAASSTTIRA